ncbi:MAG: methyltransferase [Candidatus Woesearchaeota archaeon]|jgi:16S rRNA G1207 methylase RsmC
MEHYFSSEQTSAFNPGLIKANLRGRQFELYTASGVFSIDKVDKGSELLIENCIVKKGWEVLDIGCGYGAVGIAIAITTDAKVTMTDVNKRAVKLAHMNAKHNRIKVDILEGDLYEPVKDKKFDTILTNPPYKAGREICYKIIEDSKEHLKDGGLLQLVAMHNKGGAMLQKKMIEVFGNSEVLAKKSGYRVYCSKNI